MESSLANELSSIVVVVVLLGVGPKEVSSCKEAMVETDDDKLVDCLPMISVLVVQCCELRVEDNRDRFVSFGVLGLFPNSSEIVRTVLTRSRVQKRKKAIQSFSFTLKCDNHSVSF